MSFIIILNSGDVLSRPGRWVSTVLILIDPALFCYREPVHNGPFKSSSTSPAVTPFRIDVQLARSEG